MSVLLFFVVLFVLVLVHEFGHFVIAKLSGMRVDEFGIGFPPKLFGVKRGETEYTFNLFPVGGFVKIYGEDSDAAKGSGDYARSFTGKNRWKQSAVLVAGVSMNVLFGWLLFSMAFMLGVTRAVDEGTQSPTASLMITDVRPDSPAAAAALAPSARILSVSADGDTLTELTPSAFSAFITAHAENDVTIAYTAENEMRVTVVRPEKGVIADEPERAAVGVALALTDVVKLPFFTALTESALHTVRSLEAITVGIYTLIADSLTMHADLSQVAGPIGIVGLVGEASAYGISALLMFTAFISLNLAVINILPFPALDGGRLLFVLIEAVKGSPIRPQYAQVLNSLGFALLILLMVIVTWNDIARLI